MTVTERAYSRFADHIAKSALNNLLASTEAPAQYQSAMRLLGKRLGEELNTILPSSAKCLLVSTAEDADYLSSSVLEALKLKHKTHAAVFWNHHYSVPNGSIAPVVHKYIQPGFEDADSLVVVKSVISGSCVVRTNILALIEKINVSKIYIASPVMHEKSEEALISEFPDEISQKFVFVYFAKDAKKDKTSGEVIPGIGGQIYKLLDIGVQPVQTGYIPSLVKKLADF